MLILKNPDRLKFIDVQWRPERDLNGSFHLTVLNYLEDYDNRLNTFEVNPDWDNPILEISSPILIQNSDLDYNRVTYLQNWIRIVQMK